MNIDERLKKEEELVEEASKLANEEDIHKAVKEATNLNRKWKFSSEEESLSEKELREKFDGYINAIFAKRNELVGDVEDIKKDIIAKAKEVANSNKFKEATTKMNELMDSWKMAGQSNKELDDALWEEFRQVRQEFFDKKNKFFDEAKKKAANAKGIKEELVAKAKEFATSEEWKKTGDEFNKLLEEWKAAGRSNDSSVDDALWKEFSEARKAFYDARDKYYKGLRAEYAKRAEEKEELVNKAIAILEDNKFTKEATESIKNLRNKWKEIGSAGKEKEDEIWDRFNSTINKYFDGLKAANDKRHEEWAARMEDNIQYKTSQIERLKKDIIRETNNAKESLRESAVAEAEELVKEKEEFIAKLEKDIEDIKSKLAK